MPEVSRLPAFITISEVRAVLARMRLLISVNRTQGKRDRIGTTLDSAFPLPTQRLRKAGCRSLRRKNHYQKLPDYGLQVHAEYTLVAHFYFLKKMLAMSMDGGSSLTRNRVSGRVPSAFQPEIAARTAEAFYVRISKT